MRVLKKSTARDIMVLVVLSVDHVTGSTGATLTITASKNGAAFASISPTVTELGNGWYSLALTSSHTDTNGDLALQITAALSDPARVLSQVVAYDPADAVALGLTNLDAAITSRMATFTVPTNFSSMVISGTGFVNTDTKYMNGILIQGGGTLADPWRT